MKNEKPAFSGRKGPSGYYGYTFWVLLAAFLLFAAALGIHARQNQNVISLPMHVRVVFGVTGFNVSSSLEFGSLQPGSASRKTIFLSNSFDSARKAFFTASGPIAGWVSVSENPLAIPAKSVANESVFVTVPSGKGISRGDYYGTLEIRYG